MDTISEQLLHTTVRLEGKKKDGISVGTGFFFFHNQRMFVVTNKHVVEGVIEGHFQILQAEAVDSEKSPKLGEYYSVSFTGADFVGHPDSNIDVAVINVSDALKSIEANQPLFFKHISSELLPTQELYDKFIGPMEDIVFIGYPNGIWDTKNLLPITRKGMTASPCYLDFEGEKKFIIDASVFPGSSGSPVFIYYTGGFTDKKGALLSGQLLVFIGIIAKVYKRVEQGEIKAIDVPVEHKAIAEIDQMIDLGIVYKSETVVECCKYFDSTIESRLEQLNQDSKSAPARNSKCICGSGKKYKECCGKLT